MQQDTPYQINEKDIDQVLAFLKDTDPENATPEKAIALLEDLQATIHNMNHENPEQLQALYDSLAKNKKKAE
jgi:hypothetical protein